MRQRACLQQWQQRAVPLSVSHQAGRLGDVQRGQAAGGGVVVDTDAGTIDARIGTQLEEARKILHIEDDVVVEPAPDVILKKAIPAKRAS